MVNVDCFAFDTCETQDGKFREFSISKAFGEGWSRVEGWWWW